MSKDLLMCKFNLFQKLYAFFEYLSVVKVVSLDGMESNGTEWNGLEWNINQNHL